MKRKHRNMRANEKKDGRTLSVHPLFLLAGIYACFTGSLPLYLGAVAVALQHECAHSFAAAKLGFRLNKIVLMPYGAVIRGDLSGISLKDEIAVAAAGPLCNLFTALLFVSLWWLFPDIYPYTEAAFYLSLYIGLGNLLPLYPLDGGRILCATAAKKTGEKKAEKICRTITLVCAAAILIAAVILGVKKENVISLYAFAVFLFFGAVQRGGSYEKIGTDYDAAFLRGVEEKIVAVDGGCTLKRALSFCESGKFLRLNLLENGVKTDETDERELFAVLSGENLYEPLRKILAGAREREKISGDSGQNSFVTGDFVKKHTKISQ